MNLDAGEAVYVAALHLARADGDVSAVEGRAVEQRLAARGIGIRPGRRDELDAWMARGDVADAVAAALMTPAERADALAVAVDVLRADGVSLPAEIAALDDLIEALRAVRSPPQRS